jgi:hypothetical protein
MTGKKKALFVLLCELAEKDDAAPLLKHAGCWERQIDEHWWIAVNGHREEKQNSHGGMVPPFNCMVEFNGWPAGLFDPYNGIIAAGEAANEETFAAALEAEIARP